MWNYIPYVFLPYEIYRIEAVGLKRSNYKTYDICEYVKFGAISWKIDILSITA